MKTIIAYSLIGVSVLLLRIARMLDANWVLPLEEWLLSDENLFRLEMYRSAQRTQYIPKGQSPSSEHLGCK